MKDTLKNFKRVYGRPLAALALAAATALPALPASAQVATPGNILEARDAYRKRDRARLATLRAAAGARTRRSRRGSTTGTSTAA